MKLMDADVEIRKVEKDDVLKNEIEVSAGIHSRLFFLETGITVG